MSAGGRKLFLGGLTKTTTTDMLFETFGRFGQVVDAVVMERNGHPRGFGFVTFKDKNSINACLAAGVTIDGREVDLKRAVPEEDMVFCPSKVFVGGLSQSIDKQALKQHFEAFGEVKDAVVMIDRQTGRSRGFGFVRFATSEGVEAALQTPHLLDGQWIDVKRAQPAENLPPPKFTYPRTRQEMEADEDENEPKLPAARVKTQQRAEPLEQQQHNINELNPYADPQQLQSAYMAGMAAQSWLQMTQQFNPMAGFYPPFYPAAGAPQMGAAADIPALLASMGMQVPEIPPVEKIQKEQPKREKKEQPKKEQPKQRAELGALSFKLPAAPAEDKKAGVPLAALASPAPFMDVSNVIEAQPSPTKMSVSSPVRRGTTPVPDQENPQVVA
jgi:RNA recognition motif-containing protein